MSEGLVAHRRINLSGGESDKITDPHQVVGRCSQGEDPTDSRLAAMTSLAHRGHGLEPAKHFLDALKMAW